MKYMGFYSSVAQHKKIDHNMYILVRYVVV